MIYILIFLNFFSAYKSKLPKVWIGKSSKSITFNKSHIKTTKHFKNIYKIDLKNTQKKKKQIKQNKINLKTTKKHLTPKVSIIHKTKKNLKIKISTKQEKPKKAKLLLNKSAKKSFISSLNSKTLKHQKTSKFNKIISKKHQNFNKIKDNFNKIKVLSSKKQNKNRNSKNEIVKKHKIRNIATFPTKGKQCFAFLKKHKINVRKSKPIYGILYPVLINGKIGGINYINKWDHHAHMLVDCRFAYSLLKAAPILRKLKIQTVFYSNTYRKPKNINRASHHGRGLAMDITDLKPFNQPKINIYEEWRKTYGTPYNCVGNVKSSKAKILRSFVCGVEKIGAFHLILTPDSDAAHQNHIHASGPPQETGFKRYRYAGRYFDQPLPGEKEYASWWKWYICYRVRNPRRRSRCWSRRLKLKPKGFDKPRPVSRFVNIPFDPKKYLLNLH